MQNPPDAPDLRSDLRPNRHWTISILDSQIISYSYISCDTMWLLRRSEIQNKKTVCVTQYCSTANEIYFTRRLCELTKYFPEKRRWRRIWFLNISPSRLIVGIQGSYFMKLWWVRGRGIKIEKLHACMMPPPMIIITTRCIVLWFVRNRESGASNLIFPRWRTTDSSVLLWGCRTRDEKEEADGGDRNAFCYANRVAITA